MKTPKADFIHFRGNVKFSCVDRTSIERGIGFDNSSNEFIQKLIDLCQDELRKRENKEI